MKVAVQQDCAIFAPAVQLGKVAVEQDCVVFAAAVQLVKVCWSTG